MTDLKDKLVEALKQKNEDIKSFIWKEEKVKNGDEVVQREVRLWDCELPELQKYYDHCETMLYNENKDNPGRYPLLEMIRDQRRRCNCELFLRWLDKNMGITKFRFMEALRSYIENKKDEDPNILDKPIETMTEGCPEDYKDLPLRLVLDGCLDILGKIDRRHITLSFIIKQGICLTPDEKKKLTEKDLNGKVKDRLDVIKERLMLNTPLKLFMCPTGLTYEQFRAMIMLRYSKYSELTNVQLETLRNRILFQLEDIVKKHIDQWENREKIIIEICKQKGYDLLR